MERKYKILQINTVVNFGSTGYIVRALDNLIRSQGWDSRIGYGRYARYLNENVYKIGSLFDVGWHGFYSRILDKHGFASKRATRNFIKYIIEYKPDIIHLHNLHGYYLNIEILFTFLKKSNIPVVWTLHDCWPITGHCAYFSMIDCKKWESQCSSCPQISVYPKSIFMDNSKENYRIKRELFTSLQNLTICPVSEWLGNLLKSSFLKFANVKVIHNGIDTTVFSPSDTSDLIRNKYNIRNKFIILGVASIWDNRKGLKDFIQISKMLKSDSVILLVGLNKRQIKMLPENIIGIKRTDNITELINLYSAADLYVNTTWEDNFPTTNIEALSCGTPVLTYNSGGSAEAISSKTGFVVDRGNYLQIIDVIETVKENGKNLYMDSCRQRAVKHFNMNHQFKEYIDLYKSLIISTNKLNN